MKHINLLCIALLLKTSTLCAQPLTTEADKISYSLGFKTGELYSAQEITLNPESFHAGILAGFNKQKPALSEQEINAFLAKLQVEQMNKHKLKEDKSAQENLTKGKEFLEKNKQNKEIIVLPSGLQYKILAAGKGTSPKPTDTVTVNYRGTLINGTEFDSSYKRNESVTFPINHLIKGWQEALVLMKPGDKWMLFIPANLGYGAQAAGALIPPNSTLVFELELLAIANTTTQSTNKNPH